jgi:chemotaxis protein MotA
MNFLLGIAGLAVTLYETRTHMPTSFQGDFHPAAFILLMGAPLSIMFIAHDLGSIVDALAALGRAMRHRARREQEQMIADLYRFGRELRQGHSIEAGKVVADARDSLLREVGPLLLQPGGAAEVKETLWTLGYARLARVRLAEDLFRHLAKTTPAVGLMGTIIGLVNMLLNLKDFQQIGPAMAVAQLATFYGLILAYGLWSPLARRIETYGRELSVSARLLERGLTSIAEGRSLYDLRLLGGDSGGGAGEKAA